MDGDNGIDLVFLYRAMYLTYLHGNGYFRVKLRRTFGDVLKKFAMFPHRSKAQAAKEMGKQALKGDWEAAKDIAKEGMGNAKTAIKQMRAEWVEGVDERVKSEHQRLVALHGTTNELVACLVHQNERSQKEHRRLLNLSNVLQRLPRPSRGDSQVAVSERRSEAIGGAYIELAASIDALEDDDGRSDSADVT